MKVRVRKMSPSRIYLRVARRMSPATIRVPSAAAPPTSAIPMYPSVKERRKVNMDCDYMCVAQKGNVSVPRLTRSSINCSKLLACIFVGSFSRSSAILQI